MKGRLIIMKPWKAVTFGLATAGAVIAGVTAYFFNFAIVRKKKESTNTVNVDTGTAWETYIPKIREGKEWIASQPFEKVSITSFDGLTLHGMYLSAKEKSDKTIICVHGYKSMGQNDYACLSGYYHNRGFNVLLVDNRAHGESEGTYIGFGCLDRKDVLGWISFIEKRFPDQSSIYLHGISMGASTVLMTGGICTSNKIKGIIADCGFTSAWDVFSHILKRDYHLPQFPLMYLTSLVCKKLAGYGFQDISTLKEVKKIRVPILYIHGEVDNFVPTHMSYDNYHATTGEKKILIIEGAGHGEAYYKDSKKYEEEVTNFINFCEKRSNK